MSSAAYLQRLAAAAELAHNLPGVVLWEKVTSTEMIHAKFAPTAPTQNRYPSQPQECKPKKRVREETMMDDELKMPANICQGI